MVSLCLQRRSDIRNPFLVPDLCEVPDRAGRNSCSPLPAHLEDRVSISKRKVIENLDEDFFWDVVPQFWNRSRHFADSVRFKNGKNFQNCN